MLFSSFPEICININKHSTVRQWGKKWFLIFSRVLMAGMWRRSTNDLCLCHSCMVHQPFDFSSRSCVIKKSRNETWLILDFCCKLSHIKMRICFTKSKFQISRVSSMYQHTLRSTMIYDRRLLFLFLTRLLNIKLIFEFSAHSCWKKTMWGSIDCVTHLHV